MTRALDVAREQRDQLAVQVGYLERQLSDAIGMWMEATTDGGQSI